MGGKSNRLSLAIPGHLDNDRLIMGMVYDHMHGSFRVNASVHSRSLEGVRLLDVPNVLVLW